MAADDEILRRRQILQGIGAAIAVGKLSSLALGCGTEETTTPNNASSTSSSSSSSGGTSSSSSGAASSTSSSSGGTSSSTSSSSGSPGTCELYPVQTEGPFYLDDQLVRSEISEGKPGAPLTLRVTVLDADGCTPIQGASVDIWHNDSGGVYSGYPGQVGGVDTTGEKFLRGVQPTNAAGVAEIKTIYPGWYPGRTTHIHFKVHLDATSLVTSQMYFPEDVTSELYKTGVYAAHGQKDTTNAADGIAGTNNAVLVAVTGDAAGYIATLTITVKKA